MQNKITNSSNGAKTKSAKSANGSKAKTANGNNLKSGKTVSKAKKTAADKNAEKRRALVLASFQAAYESHQKTLKNG
ncbi:MAG: hypothetical protein ACR2F2_07820 [Pyrinomonadaceae bacterium]